MKKRIAIVTGASQGIGKEFVKQLLSKEIDEIWAVARNEEKLEMLRRELSEKIIPLSKDLSVFEEINSLREMLEKKNPTVVWLVNNAGTAKMGLYEDFKTEELERSIRLNCSAVAALCTICIPYMERGSRILNISSAASFQPMPFLNLYAASKVFVRYYSRGLNAELKRRGISVTAVCPGWVDTELLMREINGKKVNFPGVVSPAAVVKKALMDGEKGKDISVCSLYVKWEHLFTKLFSEKTAMNIWLKGIQKYGYAGK